MKNGIILFIIGFVLGAGSVWIYLENKPLDTDVYIADETSSDTLLDNRVPLRNNSIDNNRIVIPNQEAGGTIKIQYVSFSQSGWVVIHEILDNGDLGNALGAQRFDQGDYSGGVSLLRVTESGNSYAAVLYTDNGDKRFDVDIDLPELNDNLEQIQTIFTIL